MGTKALRGRENWQNEGGQKAIIAENEFHGAFLKEFENSDFQIRSKPKELGDIYRSVKLKKEVLDEIYSPKEGYGAHGIHPDYAIDNKKTRKTIYIEIKRQDGWTGKCNEHKKDKIDEACDKLSNKHHKYCSMNGAAGRGNAHERSCKYFTPGLQKILRKHGKMGENILPFWLVIQGDIGVDPKRVREITMWFDGNENNFFFWRDTSNEKSLMSHFNNKLRKFLE